jgi:hypothetical protein
LRLRGRDPRSDAECGGDSPACHNKRLHRPFHDAFPPSGPAIDVARLSCPPECFEQSDTVRDELNN